MNNRGLTSRLRQQSRRTGLAVGFAMAAAVALCIGVFVVAYAGLDPLTSDFIARPTPTATARPSDAGDTAQNTNSGNNQPADNSSSDDTPPSNDQPEPTSTPAPPTPTPNAFTPDYVSNTEQGVNFRSGPGTDNDIIQVLDASTPLQSTGNQQTDGDGLIWMEFKTQDGTTGWIRQLDAVPNS